MDETLEKLLKNSFKAGMLLANGGPLPNVIYDEAWNKWKAELLALAPDMADIRLYSNRS